MGNLTWEVRRACDLRSTVSYGLYSDCKIYAQITAELVGQYDRLR